MVGKCSFAVLAPALFISACGGAPATPAPAVPTAPPGSAPAASANAASPAAGAHRPTCVVKGSGQVGFLALTHGGRPFASLRMPAAWAELELEAGQPNAKLVARTAELDLVGEVAVDRVDVSPSQRTLTQGWFAVERLRLDKVSADGNLTGTVAMPRVIASVPALPMTLPCGAVALGGAPWATAIGGTVRVLKRGARGAMYESPGGRVLAQLAVPPMPGPGHPQDHYAPYHARVLDQRGNDVKLAVRDMGATIEFWTSESALVPTTTPEGRTATLAAQADLLQMQMLASLGQRAGQRCAHPLNIYVRDGANVVPVGSFHAGAVHRRASAPAAGADEVPVDLGETSPNALVPFVRASALAQCNVAAAEPIYAVAPGMGLTLRATPAASPTRADIPPVDLRGAATGRPRDASGDLRLGPGSSPPLQPNNTQGERKVAGPTGDALVGSLSSTVPVPDAVRVLAGLRARFRHCYKMGLNSDPSMSGKLVIMAKIGPNGEVHNAAVASNTGLSPGVAACVAKVVRRAQFSSPGRSGSTVRVPVTFVQKK